MKRNISLIIGSSIVIATAGYYGFLIYRSTAGLKSDQPVAAAPVLSLDEKSLTDLRNRSLNGNLPLVLDGSILGNSKLFQPKE